MREGMARQSIRNGDPTFSLPPPNAESYTLHRELYEAEARIPLASEKS